MSLSECIQVINYGFLDMCVYFKVKAEANMFSEEVEDALERVEVKSEVKMEEDFDDEGK